MACHLDPRRMWPGCFDEAHSNQPFPGARTIGKMPPTISQLKPDLKDHIVGNHALQSRSDRESRSSSISCGSYPRYGNTCSDDGWHLTSADQQGPRPLCRRLPDRRRLLGNTMVDHTNEMCGMLNSRSCPTVRGYGWGPHTGEHHTCNTALIADIDYGMDFLRDELVRELDQLEESSRQLQIRTCEAEKLLSDTNHPLELATKSLHLHHSRLGADASRSDAFEEALVLERLDLYKWSGRIDEEIQSANAQARLICQLGDDMTSAFHTRHTAHHKPTMRMENYSLKFKPNSSQRSLTPEMWAYRVRELVQRSYAVRKTTAQVCTRLQRLARDTPNEMWQNANLSTNELVSIIEKYNREKTSLTSTLDKDVREIGDLERTVSLMKLDIHEKEASLAKYTDDKSRKNLCSQAFLTGLKDDIHTKCADIKLIKRDLAEVEKTLAGLRHEKADIDRRLSFIDHNLKVDAGGCLPLRKELNIETQRGVVLKVPLKYT